MTISRLDRAVSDVKNIYMVFQPQFNSDGEIRGFEALARLKMKDEEETFSPEIFIPALEEVHSSCKVGYTIFLNAIRFFERKALFCKGIHLSINISPAQLQNRIFIEYLVDYMKEHKTAKQKIILEVTESSPIVDMALALKNMETLLQNGVRFAIDDFGVGYSSFKYIKKLPFAELKIDRLFMSGLISTDLKMAGRCRVIINCFVELGRGLGVDVVAEGIEFEAQRSYVSERGCIGQGYFLGRPMSECAAEAFLDNTLVNTLR